MAKVKEEESTPPKKVWTADEPFEDEEMEKEVATRAQAEARREYLKNQHLKALEEKSKPVTTKKKSKLWGDD